MPSSRRRRETRPYTSSRLESERLMPASSRASFRNELKSASVNPNSRCLAMAVVNRISAGASQGGPCRWGRPALSGQYLLHRGEQPCRVEGLDDPAGGTGGTAFLLLLGTGFGGQHQ